MSCKVEKIGTNKAKLTIEIDKERFLKAEDTVFNHEKGKLSAPGFRKGKVTKEMAFKVYGRGAFLEETINQCINDTYYEEVKTSEVRTLAPPKINVVQVDFDKPFIYEAEVAIVPDFTLGKYKGVEVKKEETKVTDEDIQKRLEEEQVKNSRLVTVEKASEKGDTVIIDFDGYVDGKQFDGGKSENYALSLGSHSFIDNFEDQLIGKKAGDEVDVNVTFPINYGEKKLAGKPALFKVKVHEVKENQLPKIDDEFVSEISEFETLNEYKEDLKKKLAEVKEKQAMEKDKLKILDAVREGTKIDLADEAIDAEIDELVYNYSNRLKYQGLEFEKYLEIIRKTKEEFRNEQKPFAEKKIKNGLILEKIAKEENIEATDEMVEEEIANMAKTYNMDLEQFKKSYVNPEETMRIKEDLLFPAVMDFLYKNAKMK